MYEYIYNSDVLPTPSAVNTAEEGIAVPAIVRARCGSSMNSPSLVLQYRNNCDVSVMPSSKTNGESTTVKLHIFARYGSKL